MKTHFDIEKLVEGGSISNELDYERAMVADRKLRLLSKESTYFRKLRSRLRDLIAAYEDREWSDIEQVDEDKLQISEKAEYIAELERQFIEKRKQVIRAKLKAWDLTQGNLGTILGHKSKTHMSELMNGIKPFTLKDLVIISRLLKIEINVLIPKFLSQEDELRVKSAVRNLDKPIKLSSDDLVLV